MEDPSMQDLSMQDLSMQDCAQIVPKIVPNIGPKLSPVCAQVEPEIGSELGPEIGPKSAPSWAQAGPVQRAQVELGQHRCTPTEVAQGPPGLHPPAELGREGGVPGGQ